jgi:hypothetical protein
MMWVFLRWNRVKIWCVGTLIFCWRVERKANDYVSINTVMTHTSFLFFQGGAISCLTFVFWQIHIVVHLSFLKPIYVGKSHLDFIPKPIRTTPPMFNMWPHKLKLDEKNLCKGVKMRSLNIIVPRKAMLKEQVQLLLTSKETIIVY